MDTTHRRLLIPLGALLVAYSLVILGFVATSPDLRLRCLLVDSDGGPGKPGAIIKATPGLITDGGPEPRPGDLLMRIRDREIRSLIDLTLELMALRNAEPGEKLREGDLTTFPDFWLSSLVGIEGDRWVRIQFLPAGTSDPVSAYVRVQSVPLGEVLLSLIGVAFQFAIFCVAALAYWNRPFDRPVRIFYAMCVMAMAAFVGGQHWWLLAANAWLLAPYAVCAMLLPACLLHFFLVYPRPRPPVSTWPRLGAWLLYAVPIAAIGSILALVAAVKWYHDGSAPEQNAGRVLALLGLVQQGVYGYFGVATLYFVLMLVVVRSSYARARTDLERVQLRWLWRAGQAAAVFVASALYLALAHPERFSLGAARLPMFLATLSFMLGYAVTIVRHKLMLVDQIVGRGVLYYVLSSMLTVAFSLTVALAVLAPQILNISLSSQQAVTVTVLSMASVMLVLWLRDRFQQRVDRQFFREKYRLDKALQRMHEAVGQLGEPRALADTMLASCREVLHVERAALYLRTVPDGPFQLAASDGAWSLPARFMADGDFLAQLEEDGTLQRATPGGRAASPAQNVLRELQADLVHALTADNRTAGLVILGEKQNGGSYTAEDLTFLNALGQITNVALLSARLVEQNLGRMNEELQLKIEKIAEQRRQIALLQAEITAVQESEPHVALPAPSEFRRGLITGDSPAIRRMLEMARKVASSEATVLIRGESGTGKEVLAQVLHDNSPRRGGPMMRVHCASLSPSLLESELFGHVKGAFTGAHRDKIGRFEAAHGGTLFLDEIGDVSLETQIKLLRVLQERCFEPVGSTRTVEVDVRLVTATHQNLEKLIAQGQFREDLYYRLNVISMTLPPLRERREDVFELAIHFLRRSARKQGKRITHIDDEALAALEQHSWPGNVRELENAIERAVVLAEGDGITLHDLPAEIAARTSAPPRPRLVLETKPATPHAPPRRRGTSHKETPFEPGEPAPPVPVPASAPAISRPPASPTAPHSPAAAEREALRTALEQCQGNKTRAAQALGMPRSTFFSKLKKYGLE